jgi:hypothetical protein
MFLPCIQEMPTSNLGQFTGYPQVFRCSPLSTIQAIFGQRLAVDLNLFPPKTLQSIIYYHVKICMNISNYFLWKQEISHRRHPTLTYLDTEAF